MPAGTIALTNNSSAATGTGTAFDTELSAGDFLSAVVGQVRYTLGIKSVDSATGITLILPFNGPSASGLAWTPIPRDVLVATTAQIAADQGLIIRGFVLDKANWQQVFSDEDDITVTLPDGTQFTGPSWRKISELLAGLDPVGLQQIVDQVNSDSKQVSADKQATSQAKTDALSARDDAVAAKNAASSSATQSAGSATSAGSSATTATNQATIATDQAVKAKAEADRASQSGVSMTDVKALIDACIPVGVPFLWPGSTLPDNATYGIKFLRYNGGSFNTSTYPKLAELHSSGVLPDARGDAIRVWDDGRGVDASRTLLSEQLDAMQNIVGFFTAKSTTTAAVGAFSKDGPFSDGAMGTGTGNFYNVNFDASKVVRTSSETRMRNMAFNLIVRAN